MVNLARDVVPGSAAHELSQLYDDGLSAWHGSCTQLVNSTAAVYDQVSSRFNDIMTSIDHEKFMGHERDLFDFQWSSGTHVTPPPNPPTTDRGFFSPPPPKKSSKKQPKHKGSANTVTSCAVSNSYFSKVELYANSRLPKDLPPLTL